MIDWQRVAELRDEIGEEDFGEVVEIFLEEVSSTMEDLKKAPQDMNLQDIMHFLKGSALNLGFTAMGDLCREGETKAGAGLSDQIDRAAVLACYVASRDSFLDRHGAQAA